MSSEYAVAFERFGFLVLAIEANACFGFLVHKGCVQDGPVIICHSTNLPPKPPASRRAKKP